MLTSQNKKYLRKLGMEYRSLFQIGKDGLSDNLMDTLSDSLEAHELVKCNLLKTCPVDVREAAIECASATGRRAVEYLGKGRGIRLYRILYIGSVLIGTILPLEAVWEMSDLFNSLMVLPNVFCLWMLKRYVEWKE